MKFIIRVLASGKRLRIDADPDMLAEELIEQLIELLIIPHPGTVHTSLGSRISWTVPVWI